MDPARPPASSRSGRGILPCVAIGVCLLFLPAVSRGMDFGKSDPPPGSGGEAKNIILFIGDGMGFEQVKAAGMYASGASGTLSFESFPYSGSVSTTNAEGGTTDSAAAATAIATGIKVSNGVISMEIPGNGLPIRTILEFLKAKGKSTGLVTTTFITHSTPAAFGAHVPERDRYDDIASGYLDRSRPEVLFGGGRYITREAAKNAGYTVVVDRAGLMALEPERETMVSGQFGADHMPFESDGLGGLPGLSEMTQVALRILDNDPDGFFLMVEGGRIDHACHANDIQRAVRETLEFSNAVARALAWSKGRSDTLIVVTADHETGGLRVLKNNGAGVPPAVEWSTAGHTPVDIPVYAWGANAEAISGIRENTEIHEVLRKSSK
jgi:alkaline phosphatase